MYLESDFFILPWYTQLISSLFWEVVLIYWVPSSLPLPRGSLLMWLTEDKNLFFLFSVVEFCILGAFQKFSIQLKIKIHWMFPGSMIFLCDMTEHSKCFYFFPSLKRVLFWNALNIYLAYIFSFTYAEDRDIYFKFHIQSLSALCH